MSTVSRVPQVLRYRLRHNLVEPVNWMGVVPAHTIVSPARPRLLSHDAAVPGPSDEPRRPRIHPPDQVVFSFGPVQLE